MDTLVSAGTAGAGTWKRTLEPVLAGTFSLPVEPVVLSPPEPPLPPVPPLVPEELFLLSSLPELAYQTPPPMISATATTAATMMTTWLFGFRPPPPPWGTCGCIG